MTATALAFTKYEGLGNDFLVVDSVDEAHVSPERAARLCDRRFGVGGDGVLLVLPPTNGGSAARMRVINADGSIPEMCGNGLRCVAVHVARTRGVSRDALTIDTDAGPKRCAVDGDEVTVDMGPIRLLGARRIDAGGETVELLLADAGNPHAILFGDFQRDDVDRLGPRIATSASFERGTNAEFARVASGGIDLVVWERGVGVTLACGTGACATAAVAVDRGLVPAGTPIPVRLPGGTLEVTIDPATGHAIMRGPAHRVFAGTTEIA